ncbi:hypothetical protein [Dyadobacter sp. CY347]|uniref:hypothetical protein n=1 Tax=Dyadobacter sp. CY347 TaxID=2909336 RepID=UPI001F34ED64|nr:hypothetical protein [Dyadobacter sp. CY347]MCF2486954.1 hypothetical protein [Dyadobacter sp. CY347]
MKTNRFEDTIRQKLESIEPDFQEKDWAKMQNYMQAHNPPTFWQQHNSWIGYAAAASVSTVMAFMYVSQRTQNNSLTADVKNLQHQIEVIKSTPAEKTDTVYLMQKAGESGELVAVSKENLTQRSPVNARLAAAPENVQQRLAAHRILVGPNAMYAKRQSASTDNALVAEQEPVAINANGGNGSATDELTVPFEAPLDMQRAVAFNNGSSQGNRMKYSLVNRISSRQYKQALLARNTNTLSESHSVKGAEQVAQAETVIPKLDLKVPYRFGVGFQTDRVGRAKSVSGEVLVGKKFSISAGISWLKVKPMEFFNEKIFREKSRRDFREDHPGEVPMALHVYNIKVDPTVVQIPLTVAFRNNIKDNWAYYASAGTNITVSAKEKISYDAKSPNFAYMNQHLEAKSDVPLINSVNLSMGLEKAWYPIVVQAEGYLYTYFNQLNPLSQSAGPGVKVKLMYQIGGKM